MSRFQEIGLNLSSLSGSLSIEALSALREHFDSRNSDDGRETVKEIDNVQPVYDSNNNVNDFQESSENVHSNSEYKLQSYWNERFKEEDNFEWLLPYSKLRNSILPIFSSSCKNALIVGCGNSTFSADLYDEKLFEEIINIDYSETVIEKMKSTHSGIRPNMFWLTMDMLDLHFEDEHFDYVVDKAAMDALVVDEGDVWDPDESVKDSVRLMCRGISRVLSKNGTFVQISFAQPHFRTRYLMNDWSRADSSPYEPKTGYCEEYNWDVSYSVIERDAGSISYFMYIMRKITDNK